MNIIEAMQWSRDNHASVSRLHPGDHGCVGWCRYAPSFQFTLSGEDLLADDWAPTHQVISTITGGRWAHVESTSDNKPLNPGSSN